jgi:hypothetical protein
MLGLWPLSSLTVSAGLESLTFRPLPPRVLRSYPTEQSWVYWSGKRRLILSQPFITLGQPSSQVYWQIDPSWQAYQNRALPQFEDTYYRPAQPLVYQEEVFQTPVNRPSLITEVEFLWSSLLGWRGQETPPDLTIYQRTVLDSALLELVQPVARVLDFSLFQVLPAYHTYYPPLRVVLPSNYGVLRDGYGRVANLPGYSVYVGVDGPPDYSLPPAGFSTDLPLDVLVTPPLSGIRVFHLVVRKRDSYGLESLNQLETILRATPTGPAPNPPQGVTKQNAYQVVSGLVTLSIIVPEESIKPGNSLYVWINGDTSNLPDIAVMITSTLMVINVPDPPLGVVSLTTAVYDGTTQLLSVPSVSEVIVTDSPDPVEALPGRGR